MAIKFIERKYSATLDGFVCEYLCDTDADVASLPKASEGSAALVVSSGDVHMVNASGEWTKFGG